MLSLERLLSAMRDIEVRSGGYVLVGNDRYLDPYRTSQATLDGTEKQTKTLWTDSGRSASDLDELVHIIEQKRDLVGKLVSARETLGFVAAQALISRGEGKATMETIRRSVVGFQEVASAEIE